MDPSLLIAIGRTTYLGLPPLVLSAAEDEHLLGVYAFTEPPVQSRNVYAGDSPWVHGSTLVSSVFQQSLLTFDVAPRVDNAGDARTLIATLRDAVTQFAFHTTVTVNGVAEAWRCDPGSLTPAERTLEDLQDNRPVYTVTIPVYPIPGS